MLKGIIDAIYLNEKDDDIIIIDFKTGNINDFEEYKLELAIYAELLNRSGKIDKRVKYIGIYFTDKDKLLFEEIKQKDIDKVLKIVERVREEIEKREFKMKPNYYCRWCQFKDKCGGNNVNI